MSQELTNILLTALGIIVTTLVTWVSGVIINWLNTKIKDAKLRTWLTTITGIITDAVQYVYQVYVEELKGKNMFTKESQEEALTKCTELVLNKLSIDAKKFIEENYGDIEAWVKEKIEATIYALKFKK